jgi:DNA repair protein RadC
MSARRRVLGWTGNEVVGHVVYEVPEGQFWEGWFWSTARPERWEVVRLPLPRDLRFLGSVPSFRGLFGPSSRFAHLRLWVPTPTDPLGEQRFAKVAASPDPLVRASLFESLFSHGPYRLAQFLEHTPLSKDLRTFAETAAGMEKRWGRLLRIEFSRSAPWKTRPRQGSRATRMDLDSLLARASRTTQMDLDSLLARALPAPKEPAPQRELESGGWPLPTAEARRAVAAQQLDVDLDEVLRELAQRVATVRLAQIVLRDELALSAAQRSAERLTGLRKGIEAQIRVIDGMLTEVDAHFGHAALDMMLGRLKRVGVPWRFMEERVEPHTVPPAWLAGRGSRSVYRPVVPRLAALERALRGVRGSAAGARLAKSASSVAAEEFLRLDPKDVPDELLLAVVLAGATGRKDPVQSARALLADVGGNLAALLDTVAPFKDAGLGPVAIARVHAASELVRRARYAAVARREAAVVTTPWSAVEILRTMALGPDEVLAAIYLDKKARVIASRVLTRGTESFTVVDPKQVLRPALERRAVAIILAHQHPSGSARPSQDDITATRHVAVAARAVGLELIDHIVLAAGTGEWVSLAEMGELTPWAAAAQSPVLR